MTVSECIIEWLSEYEKMEFAECAVDQIEAEDGTYAIFKTPNKNITEYTDGSQNVSIISRCWQIWKTGWKKRIWKKIIRNCQKQEI